MKEIEIPEGYEAKIKGNKVIIERLKSENERIRKEIIRLIQGGGYVLTKVKEEMLSYLENQKEQTPAEWSEENKEIMHDIIKYHYDQGEISSKHNKWASWLEHKYFSLQSHWKPSENKDVYEIAYERYPINNRLVREVTKDINEDTRDGFIDGYNYCNSTHWKPSEEQMKALGQTIVFYKDNPAIEQLQSLYDKLQKL